MLQLGVGVHIWDLLASRFFLKQDFFLRVYVIQVIVSPVMLAVKLSLLLLYLQLFRRNVTLRYWIYFGIAFLSTFYLACMLYHIILCTPRSGQTWYEASIAPRYFKRIPLGVAQGAVNVASDFYILFLPMRGVWQLQLPTRTKVGISAIFLSGFFACLSSTVGLVYRIKENQSKDKTWNLLPVLVLTTVEMSVGVMCSCMPAFARFFRHHPAFPRILFSTIDLTLKKFHRLVSAISNRVTEKSSYSQMEKGDSSAPRQEAHHPNLGTGLRKAQEQGLGPSKLNLDEDSEAQHSEPALSQTVEVQTLKSQNSGIRIFQDWDVSSSEAQGSGPGTSRSERHAERQASSQNPRRHWWEIEGIITNSTLSRTEN